MSKTCLTHLTPFLELDLFDSVTSKHIITSVDMVPGTAVMVAYESCMTIYHQLQLKKSYGLICIMGFGNGTHND